MPEKKTKFPDMHDPTKMIAHYVFKTRQMAFCAAVIMGAALRSPSEFWPDELDFSGVALEDKNCIGNTYKALIGLKLIRKTGGWRGSKATTTGRKGSPVFAYQVSAVGAMRTLLQRIQPELAKELQPQKELQLA